MKKDTKYYLGQDFSIDETSLKIIDTYREFLKLNEGFVKIQSTDDLKLPNLKTPSDMELIKKEIDKVCENGKIFELLSLSNQVL